MDERELKQNYLRSEIIDKNYSPEQFSEYLVQIKGDEGTDIDNWTMDELQKAVSAFQNYYDSVQGPPQVQPNNEEIPPQEVVENNNPEPQIENNAVQVQPEEVKLEEAKKEEVKKEEIKKEEVKKEETKKEEVKKEVKKIEGKNITVIYLNYLDKYQNNQLYFH